MHSLLFISAHSANRLEEVGAALIAIAGGLLFLAAMTPMGRRGGQWLAGIALAAAGVLWVIALHWRK
jgi:hypothetical protein